MKNALKQSSKALLALLFTVVITATALNASGQPSAFNLDTGTESENADMSPYSTGDVNGDGKVDALDASLVLQYDAGLITFTEEQIIRADVNDDGKADALDASLILQYDAGLIIYFPVEIPQLTPLVDELENQIKEDWLKRYSCQPGYPDEYNIDCVNVYKYYGIYNSCVVLMMSDAYTVHTQAPTQEEVAGYVFYYGSSRQIVVYSERKFCGLSQAYEQGLLTKQDIRNIHVIHSTIYWIVTR